MAGRDEAHVRRSLRTACKDLHQHHMRALVLMLGGILCSHMGEKVDLRLFAQALGQVGRRYPAALVARRSRQRYYYVAALGIDRSDDADELAFANMRAGVLDVQHDMIHRRLGARLQRRRLDLVGWLSLGVAYAHGCRQDGERRERGSMMLVLHVGLLFLSLRASRSSSASQRTDWLRLTANLPSIRKHPRNTDHSNGDPTQSRAVRPVTPPQDAG